MRSRLNQILLAAALAPFSLAALAQDEDEGFIDGWSGKGEFGFVKTTGNSETESLNLKLEFVKETELWRHRMAAAALMSSKDGEDDAERYQAEFQSDRKLDEVSYIFGVARWDSDKFGAYDPQTSLTVGYGRELIKTDTHHLKGEIGVGYRNLEERVTGESSSDAIMRLLLEDTWKLTDNTEWGNRLLVESGSDNTFTQFNTGLNVAMNAKFAIKLGFEVRNNTDIPPDSTDKTDTTTTVNLVYNF